MLKDGFMDDLASAQLLCLSTFPMVENTVFKQCHNKKKINKIYDDNFPV